MRKRESGRIGVNGRGREHHIIKISGTIHLVSDPERALLGIVKLGHKLGKTVSQHAKGRKFD